MAVWQIIVKDTNEVFFTSDKDLAERWALYPDYDVTESVVRAPIDTYTTWMLDSKADMDSQRKYLGIN